jgi:hypothetical protein
MITETEYSRLETASLADIELILEGRIFHVTKREFWPSIIASGAILHNRDGSLATTFGFSNNSYFRNRGCVSVFDYRQAATEEIKEFRNGCHPFGPARGDGAEIAILLLDPAIGEYLVPWSNWKTEEAYREMIVPHVEAGYPDRIPLDAIEQVIFLRLLEDPQSLAAVLRHARKRALDKAKKS